MKNKTQPYLAGRFFDSISSGLFMMALHGACFPSPKWHIRRFSFSELHRDFFSDNAFLFHFSGPTLTKSTPRAQSMDSIGHGFGGVHCLLVRV